MGLLMLACILATTGDGSSVTAYSAEMTRTQIFDHVSVEVADPGPWVIRTRKEAGWVDVDVDSFASTAPGLRDIHFRANQLGPAGPEVPAGSQWRINVKTNDGKEYREGFLVKSGTSGTRSLQMDVRSFRGEHLEVEFPEGSGFFKNLRIPGANLNLVDALRLRFEARIFGILPTNRTEKDFRWVSISLERGKVCALRRSEASVRALVRYIDPHAQKLLICGNLLLQEIDLAVPAVVMELGFGISLRNGFEVPHNSQVLLPEASAFKFLHGVLPGSKYKWVVFANPSGVFIHWLDLQGRTLALDPRLYIRMAGHSAVVGYQVDDIDKKWSEAAGSQETVILGQRVAVLGGADWYEMIQSPEFAVSLEKSLNKPPSRWTVSLEPLP